MLLYVIIYLLIYCLFGNKLTVPLYNHFALAMLYAFKTYLWPNHFANNVFGVGLTPAIDKATGWEQIDLVELPHTRSQVPNAY